MKRSSSDLLRKLTPYSLVLPSTIILIVMMVFPIIQIFQFSFSKVTLPDFSAQFIGLKNFLRILHKSEIGKDALNTLEWTVVSLILRFVLGMGAALLIDSAPRGMRAVRVLSLLPWIMPSIVAANIWRWIYSTDFGILNYFLRLFDPKITVNWLGNAGLALGSVLFAFSWVGFPFVMLMLLAGLQGIPEEYKEAARMEGANAWQVFLRITLPTLRPVVLTLFALQLIDGINSFDLLFVLTAGGPGGASEIFSLAIYRYAFSNFDFSGAAALSVMLILIIALPFIVYIIVTGARSRAAGTETG
jgi:multiple sugar transport system permease protein